MMLIETDTWEQYTQVQNATLGLGNYRASGPTEVNDEPVMYIAGTRFMIQSVQVWTGWRAAPIRCGLRAKFLDASTRFVGYGLDQRYGATTLHIPTTSCPGGMISIAPG